MKRTWMCEPYPGKKQATEAAFEKIQIVDLAETSKITVINIFKN